MFHHQTPLCINRKQWLRWAGACASAAYLGACAQQTTAPQTPITLLDGSRTAPDFFLKKVTLVNFWATSCTTCIKEMPELIRTHEKFHDKGFEVVAIAMSYDQPTYVLNYAQSRKLPFAVGLDSTGQLAKDWGDVNLTPTSFLVNQQGHIVKRYLGAPDFAALHQLIEQLLG